MESSAGCANKTNEFTLQKDYNTQRHVNGLLSESNFQTEVSSLTSESESERLNSNLFIESHLCIFKVIS
jgi:hypothetical protein